MLDIAVIEEAWKTVVFRLEAFVMLLKVARPCTAMLLRFVKLEKVLFGPAFVPIPFQQSMLP